MVIPFCLSFLANKKVLFVKLLVSLFVRYIVVFYATKIKLKVKNNSGLKTNMFFHTLFFCPILNSYQVSNLTKITNHCLLKV